MTILRPLRGSDGEMRRVRSISSGISKRLSALDSPDEAVASLSREELQDLNRLVGIADFLLCKYADKKDAYTVFKEFASIVARTADSLEQIDDDISELMLSADDSVGRITDMRERISERVDVDPKYLDGPDHMVAECGESCLAEPAAAAPDQAAVSEPAKRVELI